MDSIPGFIVEALTRDIIGHGELVQCIKLNESINDGRHPDWQDVLRQLLASGKVEVGRAILVSNDYVEFVAWKGTIEQRIARAAGSVNSEYGPAQQFAYWLCLKENVDRYEDAA
jgi:hypothetical protein